MDFSNYEAVKLIANAQLKINKMQHYPLLATLSCDKMQHYPVIKFQSQKLDIDQDL